MGWSQEGLKAMVNVRVYYTNGGVVRSWDIHGKHKDAATVEIHSKYRELANAQLREIGRNLDWSMFETKHSFTMGKVTGAKAVCDVFGSTRWNTI